MKDLILEEFECADLKDWYIIKYRLYPVNSTTDTIYFTKREITRNKISSKEMNKRINKAIKDMKKELNSGGLK